MKGESLAIQEGAALSRQVQGKVYQYEYFLQQENYAALPKMRAKDSDISDLLVHTHVPLLLQLLACHYLVPDPQGARNKIIIIPFP